MPDHLTQLESHVQRDIDVLRARVRGMADLVLSALEEAVAALVERNRPRGYGVVLRDAAIDRLEDHIDRLCQEFLVRHLPVAAQLRFVISVIKINAELERIGDYAESVARRAIDLSALAPHPIYPRLAELAELSFRMLRQSVDAFVRDEPAAARETLDMDRDVNAALRQIHRELEHPSLPTAEVESIFTILSIADRFERVADRACNVAENVVYMCTGETMRHLPREDKRVLFLSRRNGYRTQIAEALGAALAPPSLHFRSAGIAPEPIDPTAIEAAGRLGVDLGRQRPKPVSDVGPLEDFHVVVTFGREAEETLSRLPYKVIQLDWDVPAPEMRPPEQWYEQTYVDVRSRVADLVAALTGVEEKETNR